MTAGCKRERCEGFSLFEVLVVVAILALMIAAAMPLLKHSAHGREFRLQAQEIAALLRYGRTLAIRDNREIGVEIDVAHRRIELAGAGRPVLLPQSTGLRVLTARGQVIAQTASIVFTPQGGSSGGAVEISDGKTIATIAVSWLTADVRTSVETVK